MIEDTDDVALRLMMRRHRRAADMTISEIAKRMSMPADRVGKVERGDLHLRMSFVRRYYAALGMTITFDLTPVGEPE